MKYPEKENVKTLLQRQMARVGGIRPAAALTSNCITMMMIYYGFYVANIRE
jgi:hypothetical protein